MPVLRHILEITGLYYACKWNGITKSRLLSQPRSVGGDDRAGPQLWITRSMCLAGSGKLMRAVVLQFKL